MYCPHCGAQNAQETRFCRGCGEDLRLISQAVTKSLPLVIAHRVDEAIDRGRGGWRSYQLFRTEHRKAYGQTLLGLCSLYAIVWVLMLGHGSVSFASGFLSVMAVTLVLSGVHDIWSKRQQGRQTREPGELPSPLGTKELPPAHETPAPSVTELTTRRLKVGARRETRGDEFNQP
ncbi:MAG: zinc ribbon domain-containing protein [Pyrinomonadaceae bacterium]